MKEKSNKGLICIEQPNRKKNYQGPYLFMFSFCVIIPIMMGKLNFFIDQSSIEY